MQPVFFPLHRRQGRRDAVLILERKEVGGRGGFFTEGKRKGDSSVLSYAIPLPLLPC